MAIILPLFTGIASHLQESHLPESQVTGNHWIQNAHDEVRNVYGHGSHAVRGVPAFPVCRSVGRWLEAQWANLTFESPVSPACQYSNLVVSAYRSELARHRKARQSQPQVLQHSNLAPIIRYCFLDRRSSRAEP